MPESGARRVSIRRNPRYGLRLRTDGIRRDVVNNSYQHHREGNPVYKQVDRLFVNRFKLSRGRSEVCPGASRISGPEKSNSVVSNELIDNHSIVEAPV